LEGPHNGQLFAKRWNNSKFMWNFVQTSLVPKEDFFVKINFSHDHFLGYLFLLAISWIATGRLKNNLIQTKIHEVKLNTNTKLFCKNNFALDSFSKELDFFEKRSIFLFYSFQYPGNSTLNISWYKYVLENSHLIFSCCI
jgi:hypothetical protein